MVVILGIETSCDETSASICIDRKVINNEIATQSIHTRYGGVVPELASRVHLTHILPLVQRVYEKARINLKDTDAIAYTQGPGLLGTLLVGSGFVKSLASTLEIPVIPVNHMKAHILAHFIEVPFPTFPFLCLTVSGGHTQIVKVFSPLKMQIIGETLDDAVGEAFDKAAKLLGLDYPGGPHIDKLAKEGDPKKFKFAMSEIDGLNYSFSGIKTSILYFLQEQIKKDTDFVKKNIYDLAASIQYSLIEMLIKKLKDASQQHNIKEIALAGGVAANSGLRTKLSDLSKECGWHLYIPKFEYCTDNAAMIAKAGHFYFEEKLFGSLNDSPQPRMAFDS